MSQSENEVGTVILRAAFKVHSVMGPGLLESAYLACVEYELQESGLLIETQVPLPLVYKKVKLECGYRVDMLVSRKVIVEFKSIERLQDIHFAQLLTYLRLSGCKLGYLLNFNVAHFRAGIRRIVNGKL